MWYIQTYKFSLNFKQVKIKTWLCKLRKQQARKKRNKIQGNTVKPVIITIKLTINKDRKTLNTTQIKLEFNSTACYRYTELFDILRTGTNTAGY